MHAAIFPILSVVAVINLLLAVTILSRGWGQLSHIIFGVIALISAIWCNAIIGFYLFPENSPFVSWVIYTHLLGLSIAFAFVQFAARFPNRFHPKTVFFSTLPIFLFILWETIFQRSVVGAIDGITYEIGHLYFLYGVVVVLFFTIGDILLIFQYLQTKADAERNQTLVVLLATAGASALAVIPTLFAPYWGIFDYTWLGPVFTLIMVGGMFVAMIRYHLFNVKMILTEVFVGLIIALLLVVIVAATDATQVALLTGALVLVVVASYFLVQSVYREVEQRELIEKQEQELEMANRQQENLLHFMSHEIKGYLAKSEAGFAAIIEGDYGEINDNLKKMSTAALAEVRKGVATVMDILEAANLKRGTVSYNKKNFDIGKTVDWIVQTLKSAAEDKGLSLVHQHYKGSIIIDGDEEKISNHVLRNLVDNSIKYTLKGKVSVSISKENGKARFVVEDTGVGITAEDKARLFTEGGHGKDSIKVNVHSTGYGLYIAKQVVEAQGGKIWAESEGEGKGSKFIVELPTQT
jgi:signal transduction histidine kinase